MDDSDLAAVRQLKRGDIGGLEALVKRYQVEAVRTAYLITRDLMLADDIMQGAFLRVYEAIDQFDEKRAFAPWFMRIVANATVKAVTREPHMISLNGVGDEVELENVLPDVAFGPEHLYEETELRQLVWDALEGLSPEQRAAIVLRYYHDMSEREMATVLDVSQGTVGWRLHAARKRLGGLLRRKSIEWHGQEG